MVYGHIWWLEVRCKAFTMYVCAQAGTGRPEDFGVVRAEEGGAEIALVKFAEADILDVDPSDSMPCTNTTFTGVIVGQISCARQNLAGMPGDRLLHQKAPRTKKSREFIMVRTSSH